MDAVRSAKDLSSDGRPIFGDGNYEETVKLLIASGVDVNATNHVGRTALAIAVESPYSARDTSDKVTVTRIVRILLEAGADINAGTSSILHMAAMGGYGDVIRAILESRRVNVNSLNANNETPLMVALQYGYVDVARSLAAAGADVNARGKDGRTALMLAVEKGDPSLAETIIDMGADPNQKDSSGKSVLHQAVAKGKGDVLRVLLAKGADPNARDGSGMTALKSAEWAGRGDIAEMLKAAGAKE